MSSEAIVKVNGGEQSLAELEPKTELAALREILGTAVQNPDIPVEKVERMFALYEKVREDDRKTAFFAALARLQAKLPKINRSGRIVDNKGGVRRYAKLEDLHTAIQPLLQEEGFAFSFDEQAVNATGSLFEISCCMSHTGGYSVTKKISVPFDKSPYRTDIQSRGSSQSYAHRYLIKMHLNIVERGEDDDGTGASAKPITKEQVAELRRLLVDLKIAEGQFLKYMKVEKVEAIQACNWQKAVNLIDTKRAQ